MTSNIYEVAYPPSTNEGELQIGVTYRLWIPEDVKKLRGIIVHQHGCGTGACKGGETAADDLHWQALAQKWSCALLGPSYQQAEDQECRLWCDPRYGSNDTFLHALSQLASKTHHSELETVPWCLWGHSGGGVWASIMMARHTDRTIATWLRSGTALSGPDNASELSNEIYKIPIILNPGVEERDHERFKRAWETSLVMFKAFRSKGAPIAFAPDPKTGHQCGDSRYLAIPFFDACLQLRLPPADSDTTELRSVDCSQGWRAELQTNSAMPAETFTGSDLEANWLPDQSVAEAWMDYVTTGTVKDTSAPPTATDLKLDKQENGALCLRWSAKADLESGIRAFVILRNGEQIAQVPQDPIGKFGRPLFQSMSFHDTPEAPLPEMCFIDPNPQPKAQYQVIVVNGAELESVASEPVSA